MNNEAIRIFIDGACKGNPGAGGWAAILKLNGQEKVIYGQEADTTNNRMELTAAIKALQCLKQPVPIEIYTDSQYVRLGITLWMQNWKRNGWKTSNRGPVKNKDLWERLDSLCQKQSIINWRWVKGHSGHEENERVDKLASQACFQVPDE
ncbi:MAG: ribonuclease HI [Holosporales bacterium]|jgi:ribonuclease HI|nr:ribonuclease HI [Holosporales bacterium]